MNPRGLTNLNGDESTGVFVVEIDFDGGRKGEKDIAIGSDIRTDPSESFAQRRHVRRDEMMSQYKSPR